MMSKSKYVPPHRRMQTNGGGEVSTAQMFVFENSLGVRDINKKLKDCPTLIEILHLIHLYSHQFNAVNCSTSFYAIGNFAMNQNDSFLSFVRNDSRFQLLVKKFLVKVPCATTWILSALIIVSDTVHGASSNTSSTHLHPRTLRTRSCMFKIG